VAINLRKFDGSLFELSFDIVRFVEETLPKRLKRPLKIEFYERDFKEDDPGLHPVPKTPS
jgi:hypothetical protein